MLAGALLAAFATHGHGHAVSLRADGGHVDVVLRHQSETAGRGEAAAGLQARHDDHVVHAAGSDGVRDGSRRAPPLLALASCPAPLPPPGRTLTARPAPAGSLAACPLLRTTVLRI